MDPCDTKAMLQGQFLTPGSVTHAGLWLWGGGQIKSNPLVLLVRNWA